MARFTIDNSTMGPIETALLTDTATGSQAVIALTGATLLSHIASLGGALSEVIDGFASAADLQEGKGGKSIVMAPWSNRIRDGEYEWDGERITAPINNTDSGTAIHGFVRHAEFEVAREESSDSEAAVLLRCTALRRGAFSGYPFDVDVDAHFSLSAAGLAITLAGRNVDARDVPFGCGLHPYFRLGAGGIDAWELTVPARRRIAVDERLLPLEGEVATVELTDGDGLDFRTPQVIGDRFIDNAFAGLVPDADGFARTRLRNPASGATLTVRQQGGLMHVYTGTRASLALEPVQYMTNAFNRPECRDALRLRPGEESTFHFSIEVAG